ncbi:MAG TPA: NAD(P)-dependent oxidoreductase [Acetobacteraceae bacterium]|nr:NAD(P)-dependent oxidoreductase [Acetobacteraceae bacterium]
MSVTVLYPERMYQDDSVERSVYGEGVRVVMRDTESLAELDDADCAAADGLLLFRHWAGAPDLGRFPRLRAIVRMGVGYDRIDRQAAAARGILVCNVPDYGTTEVADHAMALALALRRGVILHHDAQRADPPAGWTPIVDPLVRRLGGTGFGIVGLGRIGTAVARRAKAFGFRVTFYDPERPTGTELALDLARAPTLEALLPQAATLSLHMPLTRQTRGMIGARELALLPAGAVVVNTARGPVLDLDALAAALRSGQVAGAGLDVLPEEPPEPPPALLRCYRARETWLAGRLIVTPHSAFHTPEAYHDIRVKSAETMRAALLSDRPQNVITPDMD